MNKKICGQKNELEINERIELQKKLNDKYTICSQLGITGERTSAYLMQDIISGEEYVLKIPNDSRDFNWIKNQKETIEKCHKVLNGYNGDVYIPNIITFDNDYIVEPYAGLELSTDIYDTLTGSDKNKITEDLAYFFYFLHTNNNVGNVAPLEMFKYKPTLEEVFYYFSNTFDEKQKSYFDEKIKHFYNRDKSDEFSVMTHADIRNQNVLYNQKTKKLAIIDFELLKERNIYHNFVPFAAASFGIPYKLLFEVIDKYNFLARKMNITISSDKVKLFHILGIFHEYGRCAIFRNDKDEQLKSVCQRIFDCISLI